MSSILVTGGTGLIGREIVRRLLKDGHRVRVLSRDGGAGSVSGALSIRGDLEEVRANTRLSSAGNVDVVVHAAAITTEPTDYHGLTKVAATNIRGFESILEWSWHAGVEKIVLISSLSVLRRPIEEMITEDHPCGPATAYGMSKLWSERLLFASSALSGISGTVLRISSPVPEEYRQLPPTVLKKWTNAALRRLPIIVYGHGKREQDFVSTADVAAAVSSVIRGSSTEGVFNIASGSTLSMLDAAERIAAPLNSRITFEGIDPLEDERWRISIAKAKKFLGFQPSLNSREIIERLARSMA